MRALGRACYKARRLAGLRHICIAPKYVISVDRLHAKEWQDIGSSFSPAAMQRNKLSSLVLRVRCFLVRAKMVLTEVNLYATQRT